MRLHLWERAGLALFALLIVAFGVIAELRCCYQNTRKTDFGVYLRAAYAVRSGGDIYQATDNNGYHYTYPPAFAVIMTPFADAPAGVSRDGLLPYSFSAALWTIFNFFLVARIVHVLARLVMPDEPAGTRRWWYARTIPIYVTLGGLFYSIGFGQVNVLLVAFIVEMLRAHIGGKSLQSGCWLAAAIVLKVFPAYLLLYPLSMRDRRAGIGVLIGLFVGLAVIPVAGLGLARTESAYRSFTERVLLPGAFGNETAGSLRELHNLSFNDNQSFLAVIHNNLNPARAEQTAEASKATRLAHNAVAAVLTAVTLLLVWRRRTFTADDEIIFAGALMLLMLHIAPVSHMHYYAFGVVLVAGLWLRGLSEVNGIWPGWRVVLPLAIWGIGTALPLFPGPIFEALRHRGLGAACSIMLWAVAMMALRSEMPERRAI
ncbi:MAG: DUF2029 domain-containing protein [Afipia sp.]|nr:DUF2029 domain-containing protein [Afipia sp.]